MKSLRNLSPSKFPFQKRRKEQNPSRNIPFKRIVWIDIWSKKIDKSFSAPQFPLEHLNKRKTLKMSGLDNSNDSLISEFSKYFLISDIRDEQEVDEEDTDLRWCTLHAQDALVLLYEKVKNVKNIPIYETIDRWMRLRFTNNECQGIGYRYNYDWAKIGNRSAKRHTYLIFTESDSIDVERDVVPHVKKLIDIWKNKMTMYDREYESIYLYPQCNEM